jgi:hypothetical protein
MREIGYPVTHCQTFFISQEKTHYPLTSKIIEFGKKINEIDEIDYVFGCISVGFGKRVVISGEDADIRNLTVDDIVEIVDFDPVKQIMVVMGKKYPCSVAAVHWMIHHAKDDVHAVCSVGKITQGTLIGNKIKMVEIPSSFSPIDQVKEVLPALRETKVLFSGDDSLLLVGFDLDEVEKNLRQLVR